MTPLFAMFGLGYQEIMLLLLIGVLLFGRKLPEVGRYLGKGIVEFKKGMQGLEDQIDIGSVTRTEPAAPSMEPPRPPQRVQPTAPKFGDNSSSVSPPPQV